jgi:hypothetical protein
MADQQTPVTVDPETLKNLQSFWGNFMNVTKYGIYGVIAILILMAIFLL